MGKRFKASRRQSTQFSKTQLDNLKPEDKPYEISEPSGLRIVVGRRTKTWVYRYNSPVTKKSRKYILGRYPALGIKQARIDLGNAQLRVENGEDPAAEKQARLKEIRLNPTVEEVVIDYLESKTGQKSHHEIKLYLDREVVPVWGERKIRTITAAEIQKRIDEIEARASVAAKRCLSYVRGLFKYASHPRRAYVESDPTVTVVCETKEKPRQRTLDDDEIRALFANIDSMKAADSTKRSIRMALITGQRISEILGMRWDELTTARDNLTWWEIPAKRTKNGRAHRVPLCSLAIETIDEARAANGESDLVFPAAGGKVLFKGEPGKALRREFKEIGIKERFTVHDLRRTARTNWSRLKIDHEIRERLLNHSFGKLDEAYDQHDFADEKAEAMARWDRGLRAILRGETPDALERQWDDLEAKYRASPSDSRHILSAVHAGLSANAVPPSWALAPFLIWIERMLQQGETSQGTLLADAPPSPLLEG